MKNLKFLNTKDADKKTISVLNLPIVFTHSTTTTEEEAETIVRQALMDFAKAKGLDVYLRDEREAAVGIDDELLLPKIQQHFQQLFVGSIVAQRTEALSELARSEASRLLLGEES